MNSPTDHKKAIAAAVSGQLKVAGISQEQAAEKTGIAYRTLRRRLDGLTPFDIDELAAIAHMLDLSITALITYAESAEPVSA